MEELQRKLLKKRGVRVAAPAAGSPVEREENQMQIDRSHVHFFTTSKHWGDVC